MKAYIDQIINESNAYADYVLNDDSYTEEYDILLADNSAYYYSQWEKAICEALDVEDIEPDLYDHIVQSIIDNPTGYCDISVKQGYFWSNALCVASFPIGELELHRQWSAPADTFVNGVMEYLGSNSEYFFNIEDGMISCYFDFSDCSVAYILRPGDIKECREEYYS